MCKRICQCVHMFLNISELLCVKCVSKWQSEEEKVLQFNCKKAFQLSVFCCTPAVSIVWESLLGIVCAGTFMPWISRQALLPGWTLSNNQLYQSKSSSTSQRWAYDLHFSADYITNASPPVCMLYMQMWSIFNNSRHQSHPVHLTFSMTTCEYKTFQLLPQASDSR